MIRAFITLLFCFLVFIGTAQASAGLGMGPSQTPGEPTRSWIVHTLLPGEQVQDSVILNNSESQSITVILEALDGVNTLDGAYTLVEGTADNKGVGTWIKLSQTEVTIPPKSSKEVKFIITVPTDTSVGEQSGGIIAFAKPSDEEGKINIKLRLGTRVYITVPGAVERKVVVERLTPKVEGRKLTLELVANNQSNINLKPSIEFKLKGLFGSVTEKIEAPGIYLPDVPIQIQHEWSRPLGFLGYYTATAIIHTNEALEYAADKNTKTLPDEAYEIRQSFWVGTKHVGPTLLILVVLWILWRSLLYIRALGRYKIKTEAYTVKRGETLAEVVDKTGMLPSIIARFNSVDPTESLAVGKKLFIPIGLLTPTEIQEKRQQSPLPNYWRHLFLLK